MNTNTSGPGIVHLHWVRETPSRVLASPVSQSITSLALLPPAVAAAVRQCRRDSVELHLPPQFFVPRQDLDVWASQLNYKWDPAGRLVATHAADPSPAATMNLHQAIVLTARAATLDRTPLTIAAEPGPSGLLPMPAAAFRVCDPGLGLTGAPAARTTHYHSVYRELGLALQRQIREWLPALHLRGMADLSTLPQVKALLAYASAAPTVGRRVSELAVDVMDPGLVEHACRTIAKRLPDRLLALCDALRDEPGSAPLRAALSHRNALRICDEVIGQRQYLYHLFRYEARVINSTIDFCARIQGWSPAIFHPATLREIRTAASNLNDRLTAGFQRRSHFPLGSLALVEAVRAMEALPAPGDSIDLRDVA